MLDPATRKTDGFERHRARAALVVASSADSLIGGPSRLLLTVRSCGRPPSTSNEASKTLYLMKFATRQASGKSLVTQIYTRENGGQFASSRGIALRPLGSG